jgi:hypothetical protein
MGIFGSSEEQTLESTGEVNNNVIVGNPVDVENEEIVFLLSVICILKLLEFGYICFKAYNRSVKRKYQNQTTP